MFVKLKAVSRANTSSTGAQMANACDQSVLDSNPTPVGAFLVAGCISCCIVDMLSCWFFMDEVSFFVRG